MRGSPLRRERDDQPGAWRRRSLTQPSSEASSRKKSRSCTLVEIVPSRQNADREVTRRLFTPCVEHLAADERVGIATEGGDWAQVTAHP
jgi:hypothetical protein